jgi:hypothetical protein
MQRYAHYQHSLDNLLTKSRWGRNAVSSDELYAALNGGAGANLRELVSRSQILRAGAFFTSEDLGRRLVEAASKNQHAFKSAWDPTCGAGDLLLRWSEKLPVFDNLHTTLEHWGECLHGLDIHREFIAVAKRRLTLAAIGRGSSLGRGGISNIDRWFPNLRQRSLLRGKVSVPNSSAILMNPPFKMIATPEDCRSWSSGRVSFAAVAALRCLAAAAPGQQISALLPDVLRSGSRYAAWRQKIEELVTDSTVDLVGKFSSQANVDVFVLNAEVGRSPQPCIQWLGQDSVKSERTLEVICDIRVGTVIPHRHMPVGRLVPFLDTGNAPAWSEITNIREKRRYAGTCVKGPFLAMRRTSSPSDNWRAVTTMVNTRLSVALENHLISIRPNDGSPDTCRKIKDHLQSKTVREWLDRRIRCRHLTVAAIKQIPLPTDL